MKIMLLVDDTKQDDVRHFQQMLNVRDWIAVVAEMDQELRRLIKYSDKPAEVIQELDSLRSALHEALSDRNLDLYG